MDRKRASFRFFLSKLPGRADAPVALAGVRAGPRIGPDRLQPFAMDALGGVLPDLAADAVVGGFDLRLQRQDPPMAPLEELVLLLHTAAEIEHSLMVQYLYAAYSLPDQSPQKEWQESLIAIARQEMGHLLATQNILMAVGAPLNLEREDYPFNAFYPFPFKLEPLSISSLARYVLAEMPDPSEVPDVSVPQLLADAGVEHLIPRVGALFVAIGELIGELGDDPVFVDSLPFQAEPSDWLARPYELALRKVASIGEASKLLDAIAVQGEGPHEPEAGSPSHFRRFHKMYLEARGHLAATGLPLSEAQPTNPTVKDSDAGGYLQHPMARAWGAAFNMRYRCLLFTLEHQLALVGGDVTRNRMRAWAIEDMRALTAMAQVLKQRPQHEPLRNDDLGRPRVAGAPFELPQTLRMPDRSIDRWRQHRSLVQFHIEQLRALEGDDPLASQLSADARNRLTFISAQLENP